MTLDVVPNDMAHLPASSPAAFVKRLSDTMKAVQQAKDELLEEGTDYGQVGGSAKPTLLQPGAELLLRMFNYSFRYEYDDRVEDWDTPFFRYSVVGRVYDAGGNIAGEGPGEANSKEPRYLRRACPSCEGGVWDNRREQAQGKFTDRPPFTCKNRCGWKGTDKASEVPEKFDFSLVNTMMKMAVKRAKVAATLTATGGSHFFTQDVEDLPEAAHGVDAPAQTSRGSQTPSGGSPEQQCPVCGSKVYDNRAENAKRVKDGQKPRPSWKCGNKDCKGVSTDGEKLTEGDVGEPWISWHDNFFEPAADDPVIPTSTSAAGLEGDELAEVRGHIATRAISESGVLVLARRVAKEKKEKQPTSLDEIGELRPGTRTAIAEAVAVKIGEAD